MKVVFDNSPLFSGHAIRGIGAYTAFLAQALEQQEDKNHEFITALDPGAEFAAATRDPSVDILHFPHVPLFELTLPLVKNSARPYFVATIHDVIPLLYPTHYPVGLKGTVRFHVQKWAMRNITAVITDSQTSKNDILKFLPFRADQVFVVRLAPNPELKPASKTKVAQVKKLYGLPEKYVLYVGDINYNKNIPGLIAALQLLPDDVELVCVGANFRPQDIPEWRNIDMVLNGVSDRVKFINTIQKDDTATLSALYSGAACYVQPSFYEGFGLPVLEAMACETVVVSSDTPALKEIAGPGAILTGTTSESLAKGIRQAIGLNKSEVEKRVKQSIAHLSQFNWKQTAKETIAVYEQVLAKAK